MSRFSGTTCLARLAQEPSAASGELGHVTPNLPKRCSLQGRGAAPLGRGRGAAPPGAAWEKTACSFLHCLPADDACPSFSR